MPEVSCAGLEIGLSSVGGRTLGGVFVRVAQRLLALAAAVWFNWQLGVQDKRCLLAYDHCDDLGVVVVRA
jgi:hypothetical protein